MPRPAGHLRIAVAATALFFVSLAVPRTAPGTVGEQRARLPPPADCTDEVVGIWKSHRYSEYQGQWTEFTLEIRRKPGTKDELQGYIYNHSWMGGPQEEQPGPCHGQLRYRVSMDAEGFVRDDLVEFWGVGQWRLDEVLCGFSGFGYNLDHFSGLIERDIQEFQSVNNDGGVAVNEPTVFRRIKCLEDGPDQHVEVKPPPLHPPSSGCGGLW